jgi:2-octaprenyl-6-methoxyphenol hydroxylase
MFEAMGVWPDVAAASAPIRHIHVSDRGRFGFSHIDAGQQGVDALGHVVINRVLGNVLASRLEDVAGLEIIRPARIVEVNVSPGAAFAAVRTDAGDEFTLQASLLVAADGARSQVRERLGIGVRSVDYGQRAVIGNLRSEKPVGDTAYERFTPQGPLALLPIEGGRTAFVWTVAEEDAARITALDDQAFVDALQEAFGYRLGVFSRVGVRSVYPLTLTKALRITATRSVLVGNAAHGLHPVAAQGFNLGMRDVAALCDCIADAIESGAGAEAIGADSLLDRYSEWRRRDQDQLVRLTDGIVRLFGSERPSLGLARDVGMLAFDLVPGVRAAFARRMMGLSGRLPRLSRGVPLE